MPPKKWVIFLRTERVLHWKNLEMRRPSSIEINLLHVYFNQLHVHIRFKDWNRFKLKGSIKWWGLVETRERDKWQRKRCMEWASTLSVKRIITARTISLIVCSRHIESHLSTSQYNSAHCYSTVFHQIMQTPEIKHFPIHLYLLLPQTIKLKYPPNYTP